MTGTMIFVALVCAFGIGTAFGVLIMCVMALGHVGEDDLPSVATGLREYQD